MKRITFITLGLSLAACSSSTTPASPADYEDTAQTIASSAVTGSGGGAGGALSGGDVMVLGDAISIAKGRLPLGFLRIDGRHFRGGHLGVGHDFTVVCKDAAGTEQTACDKTTDSATVTVKSTGNLMTQNLTASVDREGSFTITGLQSDTATFDGSSTFSLDTTLTSIFHEGVTKTFTFDASAMYKAITIATENREITGGSASFDVKAHRTVTGTDMAKGDVDKTFEVHADLTFNGDGTATLVLDGTQTFTIDLDHGKCSKGHDGGGHHGGDDDGDGDGSGSGSGSGGGSGSGSGSGSGNG
jgi:hypothetical protein